MASIKDSFDEIVQDDFSVIKIIILALPVYLCVKSFIDATNINSAIFWTILVSILIFGVALKCTYNVRIGETHILPPLKNIFGIFWAGVKGIIALAPLAIVAYLLEILIINFLDKIFAGTDILRIFIWITSGICSSLVYTGYILYAKSFKIIDAYNVVLIAKYCIDVLIAIIFMKIKLLIVNLIILVPVLYVIWLFFGLTHGIALFYYCVIFVLNIALIGHYLAQVDYEIIIPEEKD